MNSACWPIVSRTRVAKPLDVLSVLRMADSECGGVPVALKIASLNDASDAIATPTKLYTAASQCEPLVM